MPALKRFSVHGNVMLPTVSCWAVVVLRGQLLLKYNATHDTACASRLLPSLVSEESPTYINAARAVKPLAVALATAFHFFAAVCRHRGCLSRVRQEQIAVVVSIFLHTVLPIPRHTAVSMNNYILGCLLFVVASD